MKEAATCVRSSAKRACERAISVIYRLRAERIRRCFRAQVC